MSTLVEFPRGVPIHSEEILSALESVAVPGYTGLLQVEISLTAAAADCVLIGVVRRQSHRADKPMSTFQALPDPQRKKPVQNVMDHLKEKLMIRSVVTAIEAHYLDGVLQKFSVQE